VKMVMHFLLIASSPVHLKDANALGAKFFSQGNGEILGELGDPRKDWFGSVENVRGMLFWDYQCVTFIDRMNVE
jgi:hypothetical protein